MQNLVPLMVILVLVLLMFTVMDAIGKENIKEQVVVTHELACEVRMSEGKIWTACKLIPVTGYHRALLADSE